jgi:4-aminobutyrate aminotransferase-like enzyme
MHGQLPIVWAKAKDSSVWDIADNKYIDFTSTIFVANVGHSNTKVLEALRKQFDDGLIASYSYPTEVRARYLENMILKKHSYFQLEPRPWTLLSS